MARLKRRRKTGTLVKLAELAAAAPQVVAIRTSRMLAGGANPGAADRAENSRMVSEKAQAFWESMFGMAAQTVRTNQEYARSAALQWLRLWTTPWSLRANRSVAQTAAALTAVPTRAQRNRAVSKLVAAAVAPVHKRATSNARRLTRSKR